jgi:hypothetical protein
MELTVPADSLEMSVSPWSRHPRSLPVRFSTPLTEGGLRAQL